MTAASFSRLAFILATHNITVKEKTMGSYEVSEHTADLALTIHADTVEDLFATAARAMFENLVDISGVTEMTEIRVNIACADQGMEELLVEWLRELLARFSLDEIVLSQFDIENLTESEIVARCRGEPIDPERHQLLTEIKSITYHGLELRRTPGGWTARVLFDI
jgi:SHS2 domain-containing protein